MTDKGSKTIFYVQSWLALSAFMVFAMAVIGAITRLTESGLSMVEWRPLIGALPPMNEAEWQRVFDLYRETPEYKNINHGMDLSAFKEIFFWEWFHRLWGRLIGVVYAVPLFVFLMKGMIPSHMKKPLIGLLFLGGLQGVIGYVMVLSGLVDRPSVSHYRLALHLMTAWFIFVGLVWCYYRMSPTLKMVETCFCQRRHGWVAFMFIFITMVWGAFVAGMDAGMIYNEWPSMGQGRLIPSDMWFMTPAWMNIFENAASVQFIHRWLAFVTLVFVASFAFRMKNFALGGMVFFQFALGIMTLISQVEISYAALHQAGAFILTAIMIKQLYTMKKAPSV